VKIPLQKITDPGISSSGVNLFILRLDQTHPHISGNKWYKLKYNMEEAHRRKAEGILTFGGAYSNHIAATAAAGKEYGIKTAGVIRGEELTDEGNPTLRFAAECGMKLYFVSRELYRKKDSPEFFKLIPQLPSDYYPLPEGGTNDLAIKGCAEITSLIDIPFDLVCCPVGTGGTLAGIVSSLKDGQKALGFSVLRGSAPSQDVNPDFHFGGYAKHTPELLKFIADFEKQNDIPLEQVYTGKMMFGICALARKGYFPENSTIVAIHTGGLQGKLH
jgi:1-aminocyclopropane-1-carboxylate deaminase/D-cysteine desulfhydrase-like pyridoxal-dependent ACC family enzyme